MLHWGLDYVCYCAWICCPPLAFFHFALPFFIVFIRECVLNVENPATNTGIRNIKVSKRVKSDSSGLEGNFLQHNVFESECRKLHPGSKGRTRGQ